ncbi:VWA domain-containing protein [Candidatus Poribacteria bacterium]|nr:VWA domain-containing protein [Candidatus Poribacteria bacterium]
MRRVYILLLGFALVLPAMLGGQTGKPAARKQEPDPRLASNLVVIFDGSGSMAGDKIQVAKRSLTAFMKAVPKEFNLGLLVFDGNGLRRVLELGQHDAAAIDSAVRPIEAGGSTPLGASVDEARKMLESQRERQQGYGRFEVLVVTDGEASDPKELNKSAPRFVFEGFTMRVIGFKLNEEHSLRRFALDYRDAGNAQQLERAMKEAVAETDTTEKTFVFEKLTVRDEDLRPPVRRKAAQ